MFIDKNSIMINNVSMGDYITEAKYEYNKLWSSDSGRNLAGTQSGTLIGVFPKIILSFRKLTRSQLHTISRIIDSPTQTVRYFDPNKNDYVIMTTYTGDWNIVNRGINKNQGFECSFISIRKRG